MSLFEVIRSMSMKHNLQVLMACTLLVLAPLAFSCANHTTAHSISGEIGAGGFTLERSPTLHANTKHSGSECAHLHDANGIHHMQAAVIVDDSPRTVIHNENALLPSWPNDQADAGLNLHTTRRASLEHMAHRPRYLITSRFRI